MISEYASRKRRINGMIAGILIVVGLVSVALGMARLLSDFAYEPEQFQVTKALQESCKGKLRSASLIPRSESVLGPIIALGHSLENPRIKLYDTSMAMQQCVGYRVSYFCMGPQCNSEIEIVLNPVKG